MEHHSRLNDLLPLETSGIARLVEEASRQVSHQHRLSAQLNYLMDILMEADMIARLEGAFSLNRQVVERALERKKYRHGRIEELVKREISEGTILLDFEGAKVGQVNGLAVYQVGRVAFGVPSRITAQAYAGRSGVINIDREADLSGRIHTKGMLILNGYLGKLFARKRPLALSISVVFEQSYGGIEGDSATAAEFFAIVSAISQVPLRQTIAVTGSMSQHGEIQPIGGVNEKVAGFFQFAREHGFPAGCGVMIPAVNTVNLMLDEEIIEAVREGKFNVYPVQRIEEGLELMTQMPAGELQPDGEYPPDSVFGKTMAQLRAFSEFGKTDQDGKGDKGSERSGQGDST
ncbi:MAG: AAA family ATPase [SAR324 cluster bacterium]|nr:AAA family ATPase [SAR324 cluster bacterium]